MGHPMKLARGHTETGNVTDAVLVTGLLSDRAPTVNSGVAYDQVEAYTANGHGARVALS